MKTIFIKKKEWIDWFFDNDMKEQIGDDVIYEMISLGKSYERKIEDYLGSSGYMPLRLITNKEDIDKEDIDKEDNEVEDLGNYKLEFSSEDELVDVIKEKMNNDKSNKL